MAEPGPRVSVVICAYTLERLNDIHEAVDSVLSQTLPPHQVIVVAEHSRELLARLKAEMPAGVAVVFNEGAPGLSEARNVGIRLASGEIVAFTDDDAVAERGWLEKLTRPFRDLQVVAVGGKSIPLWPNGHRPSWFPEELDWIVGCTYQGLPRRGNQVRNVIGCNMAFKRDVFEQAGLWEPNIGGIGQSQKGGEEAELCLRIKGKMPGCRILYEPDSVIYHKVPAWRTSLRWTVKNSFAQGVCKARVNRFRSGVPSQPALSTESSYLRYLLLTAIPSRLKHGYRPSALLQAGAILICIAATVAGYWMGRWRPRRPVPAGVVKEGI